MPITTKTSADLTRQAAGYMLAASNAARRESTYNSVAKPKKAAAKPKKAAAKPKKAAAKPKKKK
jgi:hypothetical protein